ncbi:hypothetical protein [Tateyamaria sp. SN6-1]|uniref:hypothetical protein n=1 Tax=Tateyamaria sp. SN6-1 TaxID=3092148 RepID=UPI0039F5B1E2
MNVQNISIVGKEPISIDLFGGNLLAPVVPLTGPGSYEEAIDYLGISGLRFPGGSLTEYAFDINNPDEPMVYNPDLDVTWNMIGLTDFMNYAGENDQGVTLVIPTRMYLSEETDDNGDRFAQINETEIRDYISKVLSGEYGDATIQAFEIGNEYWGSGGMNAIEYGRLASEMALIIDDELQNHDQNDVDILVQKGNNFDNSRLSDDYEGVSSDEALEDINEVYNVELEDDALFSNGDINWAYVNAKIILSQFDTEQEMGAVDGVVTHIYSRGEVAEQTRYFDLDQMHSTWLAENPELEIYITEWNLKSEPNLDRDEDYGLFQAQEMLNIMEEFIGAGVDHAHVWPLVQRTANPLSEGTEFTGATAPGEMFAMMVETLPGKTLIDLNQEDRDTEVNDGSISTHMFAGEEELVLYVMNNSRENGANAEVDISGFVEDFGGFEALVLGVEDGEAPGDNSSDATIEEVDADWTANAPLEVSLSPGEVMQIILTDVTPTDGFLPIWEQANSEDPFAILNDESEVEDETTSDSGENTSDELPLPPIPIDEGDQNFDEEEAEEEEEDGFDFGFELGIGLLFLMGLAGAGF